VTKKFVHHHRSWCFCLHFLCVVKKSLSTLTLLKFFVTVLENHSTSPWIWWWTEWTNFFYPKVLNKVILFFFLSSKTFLVEKFVHFVHHHDSWCFCLHFQNHAKKVLSTIITKVNFPLFSKMVTKKSLSRVSRWQKVLSPREKSASNFLKVYEPYNRSTFERWRSSV